MMLQELRHPRAVRHLAGSGHHRDLHRRFLLRHVDGRAGHRVRYRQRHLHHPVCRYPRPVSPLRVSPAGRYVVAQRAASATVVAGAGAPRHPCDDRPHRPRQRRRAPYPRAVCQASGRPQDVRRPGIHPAHEGEYVRRSAHHLRAVHRFSACHGLGLRRHPRQGYQPRRLLHLQRDRHEVRSLPDRVLPDDHWLQLLLCHHSVQPR